MHLLQYRITVVVIITTTVVLFSCHHKKRLPAQVSSKPVNAVLWEAPDTSIIPHSYAGDQVRYGRDLIANTARYIGPNGKVSKAANGMNCQNCHLEAGTKPWGNNYSGVYATYPKFRSRSGSIETIVQRVNDCLKRSLNGNPLDSSSREMKAILAYMQWLGEKVPKGKQPAACGIEQIPLLDRAADPQKGKIVFTARCVLCHGADGQGKLNSNGLVYDYPPLWGPHSYNTAAGLYRISHFAGYVKNNMPQGATHASTVLTNEEAWDVAAYVNSQPRPLKRFPKDWPKLASKPFDHPFGPYADSFSERQHKYGPFGVIRKN